MARKTVKTLTNMAMKPATMMMSSATMASMMGGSATKRTARKPAAKQGRRK